VRELRLRVWDGPIDALALRIWAFDKDLRLLSQDEDLILGDREFVPALIALAEDKACPKAEYILDCLDTYFADLVWRAEEIDVAFVRATGKRAATSKNDAVRLWGEKQLRRRSQA
jgi:hypothetical protein